jgi:hypothetical protein
VAGKGKMQRRSFDDPLSEHLEGRSGPPGPLKTALESGTARRRDWRQAVRQPTSGSSHRQVQRRKHQLLITKELVKAGC